MKTLSLVDSDIYYNIYTESEYPQGTTLVVHNRTSDVLFVTHSASQPDSDTLLCEFIAVGQTVVVHANGLPIWIKGSNGPIVVQAITEKLVAPFNVSDMPHDVFTWDEEGYRRLRVDSGQTSFFTGRQGRSFKEFSIAASGTYLIQVVVPVNTVLWNVNLTVDAGSIRFATYSGGTPSVTLTDPIQSIPKNTMSSRPTPLYTLQNTLVGGAATLTGGTLIDVARVVTSGATAQQTTVGSSPFSERGVGIGTYHFVLNNFSNGTATGVLSLYWEER